MEQGLISRLSREAGRRVGAGVAAGVFRRANGMAEGDRAGAADLLLAFVRDHVPAEPWPVELIADDLLRRRVAARIACLAEQRQASADLFSPEALAAHERRMAVTEVPDSRASYVVVRRVVQRRRWRIVVRMTYRHRRTRQLLHAYHHPGSFASREEAEAHVREQWATPPRDLEVVPFGSDEDFWAAGVGVGGRLSMLPGKHATAQDAEAAGRAACDSEYRRQSDRIVRLRAEHALVEPGRAGVEIARHPVRVEVKG